MRYALPVLWSDVCRAHADDTEMPTAGATASTASPAQGRDAATLQDGDAMGRQAPTDAEQNAAIAGLIAAAELEEDLLLSFEEVSSQIHEISRN